MNNMHQGQIQTQNPNLNLTPKKISNLIEKDPASNNDQNLSKFKSCLQNLFLVFERHIKFIVEYYAIINRRARNQNFIADTFSIMSKILISFNNICEYFSEETLKFLEMNKTMNISKLKISIFKSLYELTNYTNFKEIRLRSVFIELMNFFENILIKSKDLNSETNIKDYFSYLIPLIVFFLDNSDDYQKIFGIEIIIKIFNIKFDEENGFKANCEYKNNIAFPSFIWEKILNLTNHLNYKIALFAMYIIQVVAPRDIIENLMNSRYNKFNINTKDSSSFSNLRFSIEPLDIDTKNFSEFFMSEEDIEYLHLFIRDKIIYECKVKNTEKCNENVESGGNLDIEDRTEAILNKIDEVNDVDIGKIPVIGEEKANKEKNQSQNIYIKKKNLKNETNKNLKKPTNDNENDFKYSPRDLDKDENLSLEDLGVIEVNDEIFDNFDDDNIPVLKNTYKRKKGSAEKLKSNQNTKNLLMSNHVKKEQVNFDNKKEKEKERCIETKENFIIPNNDVTRGTNNIPGLSKNLRINTPEINNNNQASTNSAKKVFEVMNAQQNLYTNNVNNYSPGAVKNILVVDENSLVDKQIKKKNVRPQNGLRPATPPLKENNPNKKPSLEIPNSTNNMTHMNKYDNAILQSDPLDEDLLTSPFASLNKFEEELNLPLAIDNKKKQNEFSRDKKYEIKSMEELFLEDEDLKEARPVDVINKDYDDFMVEPVNVAVKESLGLNGYDEEILSSFENLNLEDFKNLGNPVEDDIILDDNFNFMSSMNKFNHKLTNTDHPILDQINEYIVKGTSYYGAKNPIDYNNNIDDMLSNPYFTERNDEIKIEDYDQEVAALDILENEYNSNPLNEELDNINKNNRYEEDKSLHADDKIIKVNNFYFGELENSHEIEGNDVVGDINSLHSNDSLPIADDFIKNNTKYESYKETKSKRPPTRYGNREDQIKWDQIDGNPNEFMNNKPGYTTRVQNIDLPLRDNLIEKKDSNKNSNTLNFNDQSNNNMNKTNSNDISSNTTRDIGNVLKNKNKFQSILTLNKANQLNNPGNFNSNPNKTLNLTNINKERISSPDNNKYSSNTVNMTNLGLNSNTVLKNETTQDEIQKNYNSNSVLSTNLNKNNLNKKNIHNLHNLHNRNNLTLKTNKADNDKKISSEFRKILKLKLTKNSDKIFANLKKLSNLNETSRINNNSRRETLKSDGQNPGEKTPELNRIMSNPEIMKRDRDIKITDSEIENYNSPNNVININNFSNTQNNKQSGKKQNYNILTNLTESKYLVASINKTPNFNYNIAHELKNKQNFS